MAAVHFIPSGKWRGVQRLSLKIGRDAAKNMEEMPHLNNS